MEADDGVLLDDDLDAELDAETDEALTLDDDDELDWLEADDETLSTA